MLLPNKKHCKKCEYKGGKSCCPECFHPNLPNGHVYTGGTRFCPRDEAKRIAESIAKKPVK